MIVLVFGGRDYWNRELVYTKLDEIHAATPITRIIQGGATGADRLGKDWARLRRVHDAEFKADWDDLQAEPCIAKQRRDGTWYNAAAGGIRNLRMLMEGKPDIAVGFPGKKGTKNMWSRIKREQKYRPELICIRVT